MSSPPPSPRGAAPSPTTLPSSSVPPPCWSADETVALIESYRDKWYSLGRNNLKATHWQEVANAVLVRCPPAAASPPKTALQCRHKMEKLRKRYRTEIQRGKSLAVARFSSPWVYFKRMEEMEKGPQVAKPKLDGEIGDDDDDSSEDEDEVDNINYYRNLDSNGNYEQSIKNGKVLASAKSVHKTDNNGAIVGTVRCSGSVLGEFGMGIPSGVSIAQPAPPKFYVKVDPSYANLGSNSSNRGLNGNEENGKKRERVREAMEEMVDAIKVLGDEFVRIETMKMDMAREFEAMRMQMEMKRTRMILHSQQRMIEAIADVHEKMRTQQS